jgi:hypothetical protein
MYKSYLERELAERVGDVKPVVLPNLNAEYKE